ncbi:hypothetical protein [Levilactobacillus fujinensis]|uniref:Uncharacterized protein n=1 Tax=Levilactobacillus fujinensis TaxID=2486024 RepID=A0ABW1TJ42_9LACO|nr:hypothetical protein [Levilactobacillus fujinensis]
MINFLLKIESQNVCVTLATVRIITAKLVKTAALWLPGMPLAVGMLPAKERASSSPESRQNQVSPRLFGVDVIENKENFRFSLP